MSTLSKPFTFTPGTFAVASQVNSDMDTIFGWINGGGGMWADGSVAFTNVPAGPALDPTSGNQLARKQYVDSKVGFNLTNGFLYNMRIAGLDTTVHPNGSGTWTITYPTPFPNGTLAAVVTPNANAVVLATISSWTRTNITGQAYNSTNAAPITTVFNLIWIAIGF